MSGNALHFVPGYLLLSWAAATSPYSSFDSSTLDLSDATKKRKSNNIHIFICSSPKDKNIMLYKYASLQLNLE